MNIREISKPTLPLRIWTKAMKKVICMSKIKVRGIVIESSPKGENDKWLTVLGKDIGRISVKARGCRKPTSKLFACTALFSYCDFIIDDHLQFYQLSSGDIIRNFLSGCDDITKLGLANHFIRIADNFMRPNQPDNKFLYFFLKAVQALDKESENFRRLCCIFDIRAMVEAGFMPYMENCINCGAPQIEYFHAEGMLCPNCIEDVECVRLSSDAYMGLVLITCTDIDSVFKLEFTPETEEMLLKCARLMVSHYTGSPQLYI